MWSKRVVLVLVATVANHAAVVRAEIADDARLARGADVDAMVRLALARNPELAEGDARAEAAAVQARAVERLPDPELKYEQWGVPLSRPLDYGHAQMVMLGVRQPLPAWGARGAQARMEKADAVAATASAAARRRDLVAEVKRTHARYFQADHEARLHREHTTLTAQLVDLAREHYKTGRGTQQDVLRLSLELARVHAELGGIEQERKTAAARLNALMNRPLDAAIGPAAMWTDSGDPRSPRSAADPNTRPEVQMATQAVARARAGVEAAQAEARFPMVMVGIDYQYMPQDMMKHGYGAMLSLSLPWLFGARSDQLERARVVERAEGKALEATRTLADYELRESTARVEAARTTLRALDRDLMLDAQRAFEAARADYASGGRDAYGLLDVLRSYLQVRIDRVRAQARLQTALADWDRARGGGQ